MLVVPKTHFFPIGASTLVKIMGKFCIFPKIFPFLLFAHFGEKMEILGENTNFPDIFSRFFPV